MEKNGKKPSAIPVLVWQITIGVLKPKWTSLTALFAITF
jgi:hypothetical protein